LCNLLGLFEYSECHAVRFPSDFYLALDVDFMGSRANPAMYTVHDIAAIREPDHCTLKWHGIRLRRLALSLLASSPAAVVAISNFTQSDLLACDPRFLGRTSVIYWGLDDIWFQDASNFHVPFSRPYWIWYGYMSRRKNLDGLLRGYARLLSAEAGASPIPDIVLVGTLGPDVQGLNQLVSNLGLNARVHFLPYQEDEAQLAALVRNSAGLTFPSHYEGFGLPCVEAMACGRPVLVSDKSSQPEIAGGLAVLCKPDSVSSIAEGLRQLCQPEQFAPDRLSARKSWAARFTHLEAAKQYSKLIDENSSPTRARGHIKVTESQVKR
jgi:glycosyltransferase involved in cell wall biosynthesis